MIPDNMVTDVLITYHHALEQHDTNESMRQALHWALKNVCACGEPLTLGIVHHKNTPCEVAS